jgi:hypothetical protein
MSILAGGRRSHRVAHQVAAHVLGLPLIGTFAASAPATGELVSDGTRSAIPVGGLNYADGAGSATWGLLRHAAWSARVAKHRYAVGTVIGYRSSGKSDHDKRLAADFMVGSKTTKGHRVARFAKKHHRQLNVTYVIWYQRIWSVERADEGWRPMPDQGSPTANHKDHVHISYRATPKNHTYQG